MHPIIIDVIPRMLIGPEGILSIDTIEADVGPIALAEGKFAYITRTVDGFAGFVVGE